MASIQTQTAWHDWYNAEVYAAYLDEFPIYGELNRLTAELAELEAARSVLDLACGTGATARACLPLLPRDAELIGVDAAEPMVEVAKSRAVDPRCRFLVAPAAAVDVAISAKLGPSAGRFDRAVCNTAIWQFPALRPVLDAVGRLLAPDALFVFNVPAELVDGEETPIHPFQAALARAVERARDDAFAPGQTPIDPERLESWLASAGFALVDRRRHVYRGRQQELTELMRIPAMIDPLTPDLEPADRQVLIDGAAARVDPAQVVEVPWIYFRARRL